MTTGTPGRLFAAILTLVMLMTDVMGMQASALEIAVIPQPRAVEPTGKGFLPSAEMVIRVTDTPEDRFAATLLIEALQQTHQTVCKMAPVKPDDSNQHELSLITDESAELAAPSAVPAGQEKEGYGLRTGTKGARIAAPSDAGLYYGVQTLIQLAEQSQRERREIPGLAVVDYPAFGLRQRYIEGEQCKGSIIVKRPNLEAEIKRLGKYKMNSLNIEIYNLAPFKSFPDCADANTLPLEDWKDLVELAHRHHVAIVPGLMSLGQMTPIWNCDAGKPYREETAPGLLCPSRPENIKFLQGLYKDLLEIFKDATFMPVGCSEIIMQWKGKFCPLCKKRLESGQTYYDLYYQHINNCAKAVRAAGKELGRDVRPWIWADEFYMGYEDKRWTGIDKIDKDIIMGHWMYWSTYFCNIKPQPKDYDGIEGLLKRGFDVGFLSASFEFNTYLLDLSPAVPKEKWPLLYDAGIANIADQARWAYAYNQKGYPGKVLGGGCATFSKHDIRCWDTTWFAYVLEAEYTWGDPTRPLSRLLDPFRERFAASFYGANDTRTAEAIANAYRDLDTVKSDLERNNKVIRDIVGEYDIHDTDYVDNNLEQTLELIDKLYQDNKAETIKQIRARANLARSVSQAYRRKLSSPSLKVRNTESLAYLAEAAHKIENHATRTLYMLDQQATVGRIAKVKDAQSRKVLFRALEELKARLAALREDTVAIKDNAVKLSWTGDATGYLSVCASLDKFDERLAKALQDLSVKK